MGVNVFFTTALMSTISATVIAETLHPSEVNILCVERITNINWFDEDYYRLNRMIESFFPWKKIFYVDIEQRMWVSKHNFVKFCKTAFETINYYKAFKIYINDNLNEFGQVDQIYTPMTSLLWSLVKNKKVDLNIIEHGLQEYNLLYSIKNCYNPVIRFKRFLDYLIGYRYISRTIPSRFVLLDGKRCELLKKRRLDKRVSLISIEASELIKMIAKHVENKFQSLYPNEYKEIDDIKRSMSSFQNRYIYLPTGEVPSIEYGDYLENQVKDISMNNTSVLIKNHPADPNEYLKYFERYNGVVFSFKHKLNRLIPSELLMVMLDMPTLWGSYSSALIYSYWWLGAVPILSAVDSNTVNEIMLYEYKGFVTNDFYKFRLRNNVKP